MRTFPLHHESELETLLQREIDTRPRHFKIFAGHLPLLYDTQNRTVQLGPERWGEFSTYAFELGCRLVQYARKRSKKAILMLVVDDDIELPTEIIGDKMRHRSFRWSNTRCRRLFESKEIPDNYAAIMARYEITLNNFLHQERKPGTFTPLMSERILKRDALAQGRVAPNECSLAYKSLLDDSRYFDTTKDYLISFIPGQCKGNICDGVLDVRVWFPATHIFFPHIELMGGLLRTHLYEKVGIAMTIPQLYESGQVIYRSEEGGPP